MKILVRILSLAALTLGVCSSSFAASKPDIIVIMADDLGFSDAGCFGGEIRTPNIDRLAKDGLRFTQFYNTSRCCPTRAAMLTGQYPHKVGLARNGQSLTRNGMTIAEALKQSGYNTAMSGKWHLSFTPTLPDNTKHQAWLDHRFDPGRPFGPIDTYPVKRGFDHHFGIIWGVVDYFDPFSLVDGTEPVREVPKDFYMTDAITAKSVEYISDMAKSDKPFFLYVAFTAPHWPIQARPEDIARYKDRYKEGWHALREARYQRQLELGLINKATHPLPPLMGQGPDWDKRTPEDRELQSAKMAVHAAMVDRLDQGIGNILKALAAAKRLDNTVIFFFADNGASPEIPREPGYDRSSTARDGTKIRYAGYPVSELGSQTTYTGIGSWWANAANTPFRYWKAESFEGGNHTPFIVHWPKGLKAKKGSSTTQLGHVVDILPTCLELAGGKYPASYAGHALTPLDGQSLLPVIQGGKASKDRTVYFEHENGRAMREGDWKLVAPKQRDSTWELYNLSQDRTETQNLAAKYPERVAQMARSWEEWFASVMAVASEQKK